MFSFVSLDAKSIEPLAILALAGIAGWFLYAHLKAGQAPSITAAGTGDAVIAADQTALGQAAQISMLQALFGQSSTAQPAPSLATPTYSAPAPATPAPSTSSLGTTTNAGSGA